jgi:hypothetical protein
LCYHSSHFLFSIGNSGCSVSVCFGVHFLSISLSFLNNLSSCEISLSNNFIVFEFSIGINLIDKSLSFGFPFALNSLSLSFYRLNLLGFLELLQLRLFVFILPLLFLNLFGFQLVFSIIKRSLIKSESFSFESIFELENSFLLH